MTGSRGLHVGVSLDVTLNWIESCTGKRMYETVKLEGNVNWDLRVKGLNPQKTGSTGRYRKIKTGPGGF